MAPASLTLATERTSHHQDVLNDCADQAHRLARLVVDQAEAGTIPALKAAASHNNLTRSIRRSIWLIHKLTERAAGRTAARKQIIRTVEDAIQRDTDDEEAETLHEELCERLDSLDLENDIATRPAEDIIQDIIRDLGLAHIPGTHPWKRRTPSDLAELTARAAQPTPRPHTLTPALAPQPPRQTVGCNSS